MFKEIGNPWWKSLCDSVSPYGKMKKKRNILRNCKYGLTKSECKFEWILIVPLQCRHFMWIRKQRWPFSHDSFINTEIYDKMNESFFIDYNHD
jgi:hypothetical protein